jgi:hypothetical protein
MVAALGGAKQMTTWKELSAHLEGGTPEFIEAVRRATAPERHRERCEAAREAALTEAKRLYALANEGQFLADWDADPYVDFLRRLEGDGLGGPGNMGGTGRATIRAEWAQALGKGRHQATDGRAWTAAIAGGSEATTQQEKDIALAFASVAPPILREQIRQYAVRLAIAPEPDYGAAIAISRAASLAVSMPSGFCEIVVDGSRSLMPEEEGIPDQYSQYVDPKYTEQIMRKSLMLPLMQPTPVAWTNPLP